VSLSDLEQHVLAYYVATAAKELSIAPRWYPHGELILIVGDKIEVGLRPFGRKVRAASKAAAAAFVDRMIAEGAFTTQKNDFGGTMHQFQPASYKQAVANWQSSDPLIGQAADDGSWQSRFAALTG
jgi:hypothetical protein